MSLTPFDRQADTAGKRIRTISLSTFLGGLICLCVLPLVLLAVYLAISHILTLQAQHDEAADEQARNISAAVDRRIRTQIAALELLAASPLLDDPPRLSEFYKEAQAFRESFGGHVILADLSTNNKIE